MSVLEFSSNIFSVGVANPNLRLFDIILHTEFGTTYNAYCVRGTQKIAVIETVHCAKWEEYLENLQSVCDPTAIDYIVMNHTEPDHSGSLIKLLEMAPQAVVVGTTAAIRFLKAICNRDFPNIVVTDGMTLDLGGKTLKFMVAPNLHWPDSMFTYIPENEVVFTCDFLGAHYCETRMLLSQMHYPEEYTKAFKAYFDCIFAPFKKFVLAGIQKLEPLKLQFVATSHGPILNTQIKENMAKYREWSSPVISAEKTAVIAYVSAYGYTKQLATIAVETLENKGFAVQLFDLTQSCHTEAAEAASRANLFLVGSPTINRDALPPIWAFLASLDAYAIIGKPVGVFGSFGWTGEAVPMIVNRLSLMKCKVQGEGFKANFKPSDAEIEGMKAYVDSVAEMVK